MRIGHRLKAHGLPVATRLFALRGLARLPRLLENTGAALQSKRGGGYAATAQEVAGALNFIRTPRPVVFDIGAHAGHWTSALMKALPDTRAAVMFEPQASCWPGLERLCNGPSSHGRITLEKRAASDTAGRLEFWTNDNPEISSLYEAAGGGPGSVACPVEATTVDAFIAAGTFETVDYMKIDVEGHELAVIRGTRQAITDGRVKAFSFEFGPADVASRTFFRDFWDCLTGLGLRVYRLGHDGVAIGIGSYSVDLESFSGVANYVASAHPPKRSR